MFSFVPFDPSRGSDSEGEWREHHWEDLLPSDRFDPEQVNLSEILSFSFMSVFVHVKNISNDPQQLHGIIKPFCSDFHIVCVYCVFNCVGYLRDAMALFSLSLSFSHSL